MERFEVYENINDLSDEKWLETLKKSIHNQTVDGIEYPSFPSADVQVRFVGSSFEDALDEASEFYAYLKNESHKLDNPIRSHSKVLDFGCGWGRFIRFFMRDVAASNIYGCDVMPLAIDICNESQLPGHFNLIAAKERLPYPDAFFDHIMAYSVFTHLPEETNLHWMNELARVAKTGCVFCLTLEPRQLIDRIKNAQAEPGNIWLKGLASFAPDAERMYEKFDKGEICYLATGGGDNLTSDVYGDAIVPLAFIKKYWRNSFEVISYHDDPKQFGLQARMTVRKQPSNFIFISDADKIAIDI